MEGGRVAGRERGKKGGREGEGELNKNMDARIPQHPQHDNF